MKVYIPPMLFNNPNYFGPLDQVFPFFEDKKHLICIEDEGDLNGIINSQWMQYKHPYQREIYTEILQKGFDRTIQDGNRSSFRIGQDDNVYFLLSEPLYIIVENDNSDGNFLRTLFRCFGKKAKQIRKALEQQPSWIRITHAGGGGNIQRITQELRQVNPRARIIIFRDSDKLHPNHLPNALSQIQAFCSQNNIPCLST